jgi:hypothetical protein
VIASLIETCKLLDVKPTATSQKIGRDIRCFGMGDLAPNVAVAEWQAATGGRRLARSFGQQK